MGENKAERFNVGKPELSYIDLNCLMDTSDAFSYGATKYARDNWKLGQPLSTLLDSLMRHIAAIQRGEFVDSESMLPHHGHIGCNLIMISDTMRNHPELIDIGDIKKLAKNYYKESYIPNYHEKH